MSNEKSVLKYIDKPTILLYLLLVIIGFVNIYSASYDFGETSIWDFKAGFRPTMQLIWIVVSLAVATVVTLIDYQYFYHFSYLFYGAIILLLIVTIFIAPDTKGSHSWLFIGPVAIQPCEFGKYATALALARLLGTEGFKLNSFKNYAKAIGLILLPIIIVVLQSETGSALVYFSFVMVLYRRGLPGIVPVLGFLAILLFIVVIKYGEVPLWGNETCDVGVLVGMIIVAAAAMCMLLAFRKRMGKQVAIVSLIYLGVIAIALCVNHWLIDLPVRLIIVLSTIGVGFWFIVEAVMYRHKTFVLITLFVFGGIGYCMTSHYFFEDVLQNYQQMRIKVAFGMEEDPAGAGYNVNQSKIAIGSGGLTGKGFLGGTQTKLKYVPEQATDFIFCTIGEEYGFVGSVLTILIYIALLVRLTVLAEKQNRIFAHAYGYCVVGIIFFHLLVNVGMVIGLAPVIGIPLPFLSYGGSSMLSFTLLLFTFLRLNSVEAGRRE